MALALLAGFGFGRSSAGPGSAGHTHGGAPPAAAAAGGHAHGGPSGYSLSVESPVFPLDTPQPLRFTVRGPDGAPVTRYETVHDKRLHLIVVRTDLTGYQHLHPDLGPDGVWSVPLRLRAPGAWRMYADFTTTDGDGNRIADTLTAHLSVAGPYAPVPLPAPAASASVDGLAVTIEGAPRAGASSPVTLRVARGGQPVTATLDRYLGAFGHLVVLRESDLSYLHVHPDDKLAGGGVRFWLSASGPGRYRAFFDFSLGGVVRTAEFTLSVS